MAEEVVQAGTREWLGKVFFEYPRESTDCLASEYINEAKRKEEEGG